MASAGPAPQKTVFSGPIATTASKQATDVHTFLVNYTGTLASDGAGVMNPVINPYSQASSSANWSALTSLFQEYRILGIETHFLPINRYSVATSNFPVFTVVDRSSATALSSLSQAAAFGSSKEHMIGEKFKRSARMHDVGEADWNLISASPSNTSIFYIKMYGSGLAASTNYYQYISYILVQFKGVQ